MEEQTGAERQRWPRSQRFSLSEAGKAAEASYRSTIVDARNVSGQASFEAARVEWARAANLEPDDGIYLGELRDGPTKLTELTAAVAICGKSASDATKALKRLVSAGFIEATPGA
jgi:Fic family protein